MNVWQKLATKPEPFSVLAPMDDVTDSPFRRLVQECASPDLFYSEFASADGLQSNGRHAVEQKLYFHESEQPLIAQIWGMNEEAYESTAHEVAERGFKGLDINMGCPVPVVVKKGACSALIQTPEKAGALIAAAKRGLEGSIPISVKTRLGYNRIQTEEWCGFLLRQGIDALIVHGRTSKEMSKVPVHWEELAKIKSLRDEISPHTVIVANGDLLTAQSGKELSSKYGFDGYMIGRGIFQDPYVFAGDKLNLTATERIKLFLRHIDLYEETWGESKNPAALKKFAKMYLREFDGASDTRSELMHAQNLNEMREVLHHGATVKA